MLNTRKLIVFSLSVLAGYLLVRWLREQNVVLQIEETREAALQARQGVPAMPEPPPPAEPPAPRAIEEAETPAPDDLPRIKGIGPVYQGRLNTAGITTFQQLAQATPDAIRDALAVPEWQRVEPERWIAEANQLAQPEEPGDTTKASG